MRKCKNGCCSFSSNWKDEDIYCASRAPEGKKCSKCGVYKEFNYFGLRSAAKDGLRGECKACLKIANKAYKDSHKEELKAHRKIYRGSDAGKALHRLSVKRSKDKYLNATRSRAFYHKHKHKIDIPDCCERCRETDERIEAHHCDYDKPMDVVYLCTYCHIDWHKNNTPLNRESGMFTVVVKKELNLKPVMRECVNATGKGGSRDE